MDFILIVIAIIWIVAKSQANKKKKEEQARRKAAQAAQPERADPRFPDAAPAQAAPARDPRFPEYYDTPDPAGEEARRLAERRAQAERERRAAEERQRRLAEQRAAKQRQAQQQPMTHRMDDAASQRTMQSTQGRRHVLEASSITGHAHIESSLTGVQPDCPPAPPAPPREPLPAQAEGGMALGSLRLAFDTQSVVAGVLYSEILGKPRARRGNVGDSVPNPLLRDIRP